MKSSKASCAACMSNRRPTCTFYRFTTNSWIYFVFVFCSRVGAQYQSCFSHLVDADSNQDGELTIDEYVNFISTISLRTIVISADGSNTPVQIAKLFLQWEDPTSNAVDIQGILSTASQSSITDTNAFCAAIYQALSDVVGVSLNQSTCIENIQVADTNPSDGSINSNPEFVALVQELDSDDFLSAKNFSDLPSPLQEAFDDYAVSGEVSSTSGVSWIWGFCNRTALTVKLEQILLSSPTPAPTVGQATYHDCTIALFIANTDQDTQLDTSEYVTFLQRYAIKLFGSGAVTATSFQSLTAQLQQAFNSLAGSSSTIDISACKPGATPTSTSLRICSRTGTALSVYFTQDNSTAPEPAPAPTTATPTVAQAPSLSLTSLNLCKVGMNRADANTNGQLDSSEFVVLVDFLDRQHSFQSMNLSDVGPSFEWAFEQLVDNSTGTIDISGSKLGGTPTEDQLNNLLEICTMVDEAISGNLDAPTAPTTKAPTPSPKPTTFAPTRIQGPTISDSEFTSCKRDMLISDTNKDNTLDQTEYVLFLSHMSNFSFGGYTFSALDAVFQTSFTSLSNGGSSINVFGCRTADNASQNQLDALRFVCSETERAIAEFVRIPPPTASPTISQESFQVCLYSIFTSDIDGDQSIEPTEYIRLLNKLTSNLFSGLFLFDDLPEIFQQGYDQARESDQYIDVAGSGRTQEATEVERQHLDFVCSVIYKAISKYYAIGSKPSARPSQAPATLIPLEGNSSLYQCLGSLQTADINKDYNISRAEYPALVEVWSSSAWETNISSEPYLVQDNYDWIRLGSEDIVITSAYENGPNVTYKDVPELLWICQRTQSVVEDVLHAKYEQVLTLEEQCVACLNIVDRDANKKLNETEYVELVDMMIFQYYNKTAELPTDLQKLFNTSLQGDADFIDISGLNTSGVSPVQEDFLGLFCTQLGTAISAVRDSGVFFLLCKFALVRADSNDDHLLSSSEYTSFLFDLAGMKFQGNFSDLDPSFQQNYDIIRHVSDQVDIAGASGEVPLTAAEQQNLQWICATTQPLIPTLKLTTPTPAPTARSSVSVFNSFIIYNGVNISASDLGAGDDRRVLDAAYGSFIQKQVSSLTTPTNTTLSRSLKVLGVAPFSTRLNLIRDSACPPALNGTNFCQTVFASFDVMVQDESNPSELSDLYSTTTQDAITNGALQAEVTAADDTSPVSVYGASSPVIPVDTKAPTRSPVKSTTVKPVGQVILPASTLPPAKPSSGGGSSSMGVIAGVGVVAVIALVAGAVFWRRKQQAVQLPEKNEFNRDHNAAANQGLSPPSQGPPPVPYGTYDQHPTNHTYTNGYTDDSPIGIEMRIADMDNNNDYDESFNVREGPIPEQHPQLYGGGYKENLQGSTSFENSLPSMGFADFDSAPSAAWGADNPWGPGRNDTGNFSDDEPIELISEDGSDSQQDHRPLTKSSSFRDPGGKSVSSATSATAPDSARSQLTRTASSRSRASMASKSSRSASSGRSSQHLSSSGSPHDRSYGEDHGHRSLPPVSHSSRSSSSREHDDDDGRRPTLARHASNRSRMSQMSKGSHRSGISRSSSMSSPHPYDDDETSLTHDSPRHQQHSPGASSRDYEDDEDDEDDDEDEEESERSHSMNDDEGDDDDEEEESTSGAESSRSESSTYDEDDTLVNSAMSINSEDVRRMQSYRPQIAALVRQVVPDEIDNLDTMMEQFLGREEELMATLRNMAAPHLAAPPLNSTSSRQAGRADPDDRSYEERSVEEEDDEEESYMEEEYDEDGSRTSSRNDGREDDEEEDDESYYSQEEDEEEEEEDDDDYDEETVDE